MNNFVEHIQSSELYSPENHYFVACSGGVDSLVALSIFHSLGYSVSVLHVNYHLRGQDSIDDMNFVQSFCLEKNIPFLKKEIQLAEELKTGGNLQEKARDFRYNWFTEILAQHPANRILLGHHLNDQTETFWLNICRDAGVMGLSGMQEYNNGILRPLLRFTKEEIISFAHENRLRWREDISNTSIKYKRNFFRNEAIPFLEKEFPGIHQDVELLTKTFQEKQQALEVAVAPYFKQIQSSNHLFHKDFKKLDELEKIELARMLAIPFEHFLRLDELLTSSRGKKINLVQHGEYSAIVQQSGYFEFIPIGSEVVPEIIIEKISTLPDTYDKSCIYLDKDKVKGEITLRKWKIGDRISPIGMRGSQLISDIVKDAKLTGIEKQNLFVLCDDEQIHWCIELKIGRKAIATKHSSSILKVSIGH